MLCYRCGTHNPDTHAQCSACGQVFQQQVAKAKVVAPVKSGPYAVGHVVADRYRVDSLIGHGPVGVVYRVIDLQPQGDDALALKIIQPRFLQTEEDRAAFMRALQRCKKMLHPSISRIVSDGEDASRVFFTMQFVTGNPLSRIFERQRPFSLAECEPLVTQICSALEHAHRFTAHGALKPENIIVRPDDVKLTDFMMMRGLPRRPYLAAMTSQYYCAPELRQEAVDVLPAADIYSLGVIVAEMLTGARGDALPAAVRTLPAPLRALLYKAMDSVADNRHRSPNEFLNELLALVDEEPMTEAPVLAPPPLRMEEDRTVNELDTALIAVDAPMATPAPALKKRDPVTTPISVRLQLDEAPPFRMKKKSGSGFRTALTVALITLGAAGVGFALQKPDAKPAPSETVTIAPPPAPTEPPKPNKPDAAKPEAIKQERVPASVTAPPAPSPRVAKEAPVRTKRASKPTAGLVEVISAEELPVTTHVAPEAAPAPAKCPAGMVQIGGGRFSVGTASTDEMRNFSDRPISSVEVKAFCVDKYEFPNTAGAAPTVNVSLRQAKQMCESAGKRLCMEDEWERACKGPIGSRFPYGAEFDEAACNVGTENVRSSGASPRCKSGYGVVDMSGNVAEWTDSRMAGTDFVVKGGDAAHPDYASRCASRSGMGVARKASTVGFRCCSSME